MKGDQEKSTKDFLSTLKITVKNASIYNVEHPAFHSLVEELKEKIDTLFQFSSHVKLAFTSNSILIKDFQFGKESAYEDLAKMFHHRKFKTLEILPGISQQELIIFLSYFHLPPEQIFEHGGINDILKHEDILHIKVEELDYSQIIRGEGGEIKDVWGHLLKDALIKEDQEKIFKAADNFALDSEKLNPRTLIEDNELNENFQKFFSYLKEKEESKFRTCAKELLKSAIKDKSLSPKTKLDGLKQLITDLKEEDFASTLWEEIVTDEQFDSLSFSIFSRLMDKKKHSKVAHSFSEIFEQNRTLERKPQVRDKIKELLSGTSSPLVSKIYQKTLSSLIKDISYHPELSFDKQRLSRNYRFIILSLLEKEGDKLLSNSYLEEISEEWENFKKEKDFEYLKFLYQTLLEKKDLLKNEPLGARIQNLSANLVENAILDGDSSLYFEFFLDNLEESTLDVNTYLEKIFTEGKITPYILKAFFHFHEEYIFYFNLNLEQKRDDHKFTERMCLNLSYVDEPVSLLILKYIYQFSHKGIKVKVLRAMQNLSKIDVQFLMPIIKKRDLPLIKEALVILMRDKSAREKVFKKLLAILSPYGIRNRRILKYMRAVEEKNLQEAQDYLQALSLRKSFWNKKVREQAQKVLQSWNVKTN